MLPAIILTVINAMKDQNGPCNNNPFQSTYLTAAFMLKLFLVVVSKQRAIFSTLPLKDTYLYQTFIFRFYTPTIRNRLN